MIELFQDNNLLVFKAILKSIRTYGIKLWGTLSNSNIDILQLTGSFWKHFDQRRTATILILFTKRCIGGEKS